VRGFTARMIRVVAQRILAPRRLCWRYQRHHNLHRFRLPSGGPNPVYLPNYRIAASMQYRSNVPRRFPSLPQYSHCINLGFCPLFFHLFLLCRTALCISRSFSGVRRTFALCNCCRMAFGVRPNRLTKLSICSPARQALNRRCRLGPVQTSGVLAFSASSSSKASRAIFAYHAAPSVGIRLAISTISCSASRSASDLALVTFSTTTRTWLL
jgi:hypothetical protein